MRKFCANAVHRLVVDGDRYLAIFGFVITLFLSLFAEIALQKVNIAVSLLSARSA